MFNAVYSFQSAEVYVLNVADQSYLSRPEHQEQIFLGALQCAACDGDVTTGPRVQQFYNYQERLNV